MSISTSIERSTHLLAVHLARRLAGPRLTQAEAHVLAQLGRAGVASVGDLHRRFGHRRSTLTSVLDRLEERANVARRPDPADRRAVLVELTPRGRDAAAQVLEVVDALERDVEGRVTAAELAGFRAVIAALDEAVDA